MAIVHPQINSPAEHEIYRNENGIVTTAGSINFTNTTGQEAVSIAAQSGDDITFTNKGASYFHPNNKMEKVNFNKYSTVEGDSSMFVGRTYEQRVIGDLRIITGVSEFFQQDNKLTEDYVRVRGEVASAIVQPATLTGGYSNLTKGEVKMSGTIDPDSGSTDGRSMAPNPGKQNIGQYIQGKSKEALPLEKRMGVGGSVEIMSGKHVFISAGTKAAAFDSGFVNPKGRKIQKTSKVTPNDNVDPGNFSKVEKTYSAVTTYQERDTTSTMPFGKLTLLGNTGVDIKSAAGGVNVESGGSIKFSGMGHTALGGVQVSLLGAGTVDINSPHTEITSSTFNVVAEDTTIQGNVHINKDTVIEGNVVIKGNTRIIGNLIVEGTILCKDNIDSSANITAKQNVEAKVDVKSSGVSSLNNHVHRGVQPGSGTTQKPAG